MVSFRGKAILGLFAVMLVASLSIVGCGKAEKGVAQKETVKKETTPTQAVSTGEVQEQKTEEKKELPTPSIVPITEERTFYDFEKADLDGWEVPAWSEGKTDYVAKKIQLSTQYASKGNSSMEIVTDFPGGNWTAALVEIQQYLDISNYRVVRADIYLPKDAPLGLKAKLILTVGENWKFVEMSSSVPLIPGEWATITANIEPGSYDWKRIVPDEEFARDVRKIAIRIESNRQPKYSGNIYIDNVRCGK
ncbi:MAG: hypothetical protein PHW46_01325 [Candidatus Omnitrophica bacterium]|nr:hypothetical protein [Candidatus Omnitrophota bacterium]